MGLFADNLERYEEHCYEMGRDPYRFSRSYETFASETRNTISALRSSRDISEAIRRSKQIEASVIKKPLRFTNLVGLSAAITEGVKTLERHRLEYKIFLDKIEFIYHKTQSNITKNILKLINDDTAELVKNIENYYDENLIYFESTDSAEIINEDFAIKAKTSLLTIILEYISSHLMYATHNNSSAINNIIQDCELIRDYLLETTVVDRDVLLSEFENKLGFQSKHICKRCGKRMIDILNYCFHCCERKD